MYARAATVPFLRLRATRATTCRTPGAFTYEPSRRLNTRCRRVWVERSRLPNANTQHTAVCLTAAVPLWTCDVAPPTLCIVCLVPYIEHGRHRFQHCSDMRSAVFSTYRMHSPWTAVIPRRRPEFVPFLHRHPDLPMDSNVVTSVLLARLLRGTTVGARAIRGLRLPAYHAPLLPAAACLRNPAPPLRAYAFAPAPPYLPFLPAFCGLPCLHAFSIATRVCGYRTVTTLYAAFWRTWRAGLFPPFTYNSGKRSIINWMNCTRAGWRL